MEINNNLGAMASSQVQIANNANKLADVANALGDSEFQEVTTDLIDAIVNQIPEVISYKANAKGIETQNAVSDILLNIKA